MSIAIRGGEVCVPDRSGPRDVLIRQGKFVDALIAPETIVDASGLLVTPGLIDIQINGCSGHEFSEGDSAVAAAQRLLPQYGVTSFLPTTGSQPIDLYASGMFQNVVHLAIHNRQGRHHDSLFALDRPLGTLVAHILSSPLLRFDSMASCFPTGRTAPRSRDRHNLLRSGPL